MNYWTIIASLLLSIIVGHGGAQGSAEGESGGQETQIRGFWTDPSTGLTWAAKDNGKDVSWVNAVKYCSEFHSAGHADWRLASLGELQSLYDKNANAPGLMGPSGRGTASTWHVRGNLFLTGNQWSSSRRLDDRGKPSGYASRFDFNEGRVFDGDEIWFYTNKRALCVRGTQIVRPKESPTLQSIP